MTPLAEKLRALIEADGPISVAEYMAICLGDPKHGYYMTRDPFGAAGDFITAPEISQMFGEIVGAWLVHAWRLCGAPRSFSLVELGPGRGTLMKDVLRVAEGVADFAEAASVELVETSPPLAARQAETLREAGFDIRWRTSFEEVTPGPMLLVANEFFDALPIRRFLRVENGWREQVVGLVEGQLAFGIGPGHLANGAEAAEEAILEISPAAEALIAEIARRIVAHSGAALIIDYGYTTGRPGDTLQAVRRHAFSDPLAFPGEADLTAHVDFAALAKSARTQGAAVHGPISQGEFLLALGLRERAQRLARGADAATRDALQASVDRLSGPAAMGTLFKALAITQQRVEPPPFAGGV